MTSSVRVDSNVAMEMRDGIILRADVFRPNDRGKHPAILVRTPYNKLLTVRNDLLNPTTTAFAGYAVVIQDIRGRFASEGEWKSGERQSVEGFDGYDSVEWIADQPWCDGNVGSAGGSYLASLQWIMAMENPPHLKAIAPWIGTAGPMYEQTLLAGIATLHIPVSWVPMMAVDVADRLEREGKDVSNMRRMLYQAIFNPAEVYNYLPLKDVPHFAEPEVRAIWTAMALNVVPGRDTVGNARWKYDRVNVPCFHVSGWYDLFTWAVFKNLEGMQQNGGTPRAREGQHVLVGPWTHAAQMPDAIVGEVNFGPASTAAGARIAEHQLAFFDKYLCGRDIEIPTVRYFTMGPNQWRVANAWPLPQTSWERFFLHSQGQANTSAGDGVLNRDEPKSEPADTFIYDPHNPVPTTGGRLLAVSGMVNGPRDQSHIEKREDVMCYTTPGLKDEVEVTGPLEFHLFASTSARDTDFAVKLVDVHPDGRTYNVAEGIIRARYRRSIFEPELIDPGVVYEYTIDMGNVSQVFHRGHCIRLDVSSSNFPGFDRNMNTSNPPGEDTQGIPARQHIFHETGYTSYIDLPVQ